MTKRFEALTGIRGAAAVWVVAFHAYPFVGSLFGWPERAQVPVIRDGFLAVDLFFILSGFVLSHVYAERFWGNVRDSFGTFLAARIRRIFPLHWVCLSIVVILAKSFPNHWWGPGPFSSQSLVESAFLVQTWIPSAARAWNHPAWSLSAEWFAYLLFPIAVLVLKTRHSRSQALVGAASALFLLDIGLLGNGSTSLDHVGAGGVARCFCEFAAGALIWQATRRNDGRAPAQGDAWIAVGAGILGSAISIPLFQITAPFGFAAIIMGCVSPSKMGQRLFGNRILTGLGEISFSVYLIHAPILGSLSLVADVFNLQDAGILPRLALSVTIPVLVLGASILLWRFVEVPGRMLLRPVPHHHLPAKSQTHVSETLVFWLMMAVAMTFTETAADFLSETVALGYALTTALMLTAIASILIAQTETPRGHIWDWGLVLSIGIAGTTLSDFLDLSVGLGDFGACVALLLAFMAVRYGQRAMSNSIVGTAETVLNWMTVLLIAALSTSLGDLLAAYFDYQHTILFLFGGLSCVILAALCTRLQREFLFWMTFVLIRPLGVTFGDALSKPLADGGLQFGAGSTSLILMAAMIVLIPIAGQNLLEIVRAYQPRKPVL